MHRRGILGMAAGLAAAGIASSLRAATRPGFAFPAIGGGKLDLADWRGQPVLVVNTASRCGFTDQYGGLQALYDRYRARGLIVLGVPSNSFRQELASSAEVLAFCEVNFAIDFPMTGIVEVAGPGAHPFYAWAAAQGVRPRWNFHKILIDGEGKIAADFPALVGPQAPRLVAAVEALLAG